MANRTNKKKRDVPSPVQAFIIEQQTQEIGELRSIIAAHEAARGIEAERLSLASGRANAAEERVKALELAHKINTETMSVFVTPIEPPCSDDVITCDAPNYPENGGIEGGST